jgi:hypothetical protein
MMNRRRPSESDSLALAGGLGLDDAMMPVKPAGPGGGAVACDSPGGLAVALAA